MHNKCGGKFRCFVQLLRSNALFLWRYEDTSSLPMLTNDNSINNSFIFIYMYRKSSSRFSRGTVLNTLKQNRINIMRRKKGRNYISRQACFVNRETGLLGNVVASLFPSHNIYIYIYVYIWVCVSLQITINQHCLYILALAV